MFNEPRNTAFPTEIKICGTTYTVTRNKDSELDCGNCHGEIRYSKQEIVIHSTLTSQHTDKVLLHEVLHGVFNEMGRGDLRDDEVLVHSLGNMLYQVLTENKLF